MNRLRLRVLAVFLAGVLIAPVVAVGGTASRAGLSRDLAAALERGDGNLGVIIQFASAPTQDDYRALIKAGFAPSIIRYSVVPAVFATGPASAVQEMILNPRVQYAELDAKFEYHLDRAVQAGRVRPVWDALYRWTEGQGVQEGRGLTGKGVGIAIIDSGIDATHPDLLWKPLASAAGKSPRTVANFRMLGRSSLFDEDGPNTFLEAASLAVDVPDSDNTSGHGTNVAGIAAGDGSASAARFKGVAPEANLIGLGSGDVIAVHSGLAAFDWIHLNHREFNIRVVNNSWGGAGDWDPERAMTKAIQKIIHEDHVAVIFSAGNSGGSGETIQTNTWANIPGVINVANYYDGTGWLDDTSSRGLRKKMSTWPDLAAPGTEIIAAAANGRPVTHYASVQDAAISEISGYGEPIVVSAPTPSTVEAGVGGRRVIAGNYASFTGTSMSSPFISGVVALMLEANPHLRPADVEYILIGTANMPEGRSFLSDGYAIGHGVVDAAEAIAVALKVREGYSLAPIVESGPAPRPPRPTAFSEALVDYTKAPARINHGPGRRLSAGVPTQAAGKRTVLVEYIAGPLTDNSIPLAPAPPAISGRNFIYHLGRADPFAFGGNRILFPGEDVELAARGLRSGKPGSRLRIGSFEVTHKVLQDGATVFGPFDASERPDGDKFEGTFVWTVPDDARGAYEFESTVRLASGREYLIDRIPFTVGEVQDPMSPSAFSPARPRNIPETDWYQPAFVMQETFFAAGFEGGVDGWEVQQEGTAHGVLTTWSLVGEELLAFDSPHSGGHAMYVGNGPGAEVVSGMFYEDLADVSLISPVIDLSNASEPSLSYHRLGSSERDFDLLRVLVAQEGTEDWVKVDEISGDFLFGNYVWSWQEAKADLNNFAGSRIRLRFQFISDDTTLPGSNLVGWYVDDVTITGRPGNPGVTIKPSLQVFNESAFGHSFGVGSLEASFDIAATANVPVDSLTLDFGDGSPTFSTTQARTVDHEYGPGYYVARLTAYAGGKSASVVATVDVAPAGVVQARVAGGSWESLGAAGDSNVAFTFDVPSSAAGSPIIEMRHCDTAGACIFDIAVPQLATAVVQKGSAPAPANISGPQPETAPVTSLPGEGSALEPAGQAREEPAPESSAQALVLSKERARRNLSAGVALLLLTATAAAAAFGRRLLGRRA